ncbi:MAG: tetratricopeptide repeat protein [Akkermansia muciniphila]
MKIKSAAGLLAALLLAACGEKKEDIVPYSGPSDHWNAQRVPRSLQCATCHPEQFRAWSGSDHAWAWRETSPELDGQPFHGQQKQAHGSGVTFRTARNGTLQITDSESGRVFDVHSVLGRTPLVQYLVKGEDGGLHTPSAAWDTLRREWFDVFEDDARLAKEGNARRKAGEWGHWLGRGMNWNSQCAWCHMTRFRKNYDEKSDRFSSTWEEPGVTCLQCHKAADTPAEDGCLVSKADRKLSATQNHDNCATCHARREEMDGDFTVGDSFDEHFRLELPTLAGIFYPNGMQQDEDYCETGLRLSKMGAAGVTCLDCHDPHTAKLKLPQEDNSLCLRCHADGTPVNGKPTPIVDPAAHGPCPAGSKGARCVECHMPESPYMARDPRRDHSFNSPDPQMSLELGIPNACTMCHKDMDDKRAAELVQQAFPAQKTAAQRARTRAVAAAQQGRGKAEDLLAAYRAETIPAWRATLLELIACVPPTAETRAAAAEAARDASPMVRAAAARLLGEEALPLVNDPCKLVRRAAGWPLVDRLVRSGSHPRTLSELRATAHFQADQPTGAMQLAILAAAEGKQDEAIAQYERAVRLDPASLVARMDYAVYLDSLGRPAQALGPMLQCAELAPDNAEVKYRIGLLLAELQRWDAALAAYAQALKLQPNHLPTRAQRIEILSYLGRTEEAQKEMQEYRALLQAEKQFPVTQP